MATKIQSTWFADLIREEGLDDLGQFLKDGFFDEIPFFSRYDQLPRDESVGRFEVDCRLVRACLGYLDDLLSGSRPNTPLFAAITVIKDRRNDPMVPSIIACRGADRVRSVLGALPLIRVRSSLGIYLVRVLKAVGSSGDYDLFQDSVTVPGRPRIFIVKRHPPFPEIIGPDRLRERPELRTDDGRHSPN